ncbi:MAG: hypothetical protein M1834_006531 [Cirrosporium novae-zelandiae]|nr:MAG: hypothetical protein M1834_006531 [Cirrosporium novae-zelandiae]
MVRGGSANRRFLVFALAVCGLFTFIYIFITKEPQDPRYASVPVQHVDVSPDTLAGDVIMPELGNATARAELGHATWRVLHTMMARFPDNPTEDESNALKSWLLLFGRLYPCGQCAAHLRQFMQKYPPQVSSRSAAATWACFLHNQVNKGLKKPEFDCSKIGEFYDCGCTDDENTKESKNGGEKEVASTSETKVDMSDLETNKLITNGRDFNDELLKKPKKPLELEKEGYV